MAWSLAPHVHAVTLGEDIVFLDLAQDAYFCLVGASGGVLLKASGAVEVSGPDWIQTLSLANLIVSAPPVARRRIPAKPTVDLPAVRRGARRSELLALASACWTTSAAFRTQSFLQMILAAEAARPQAACSPAALDAAAVFARLRPWSPVGGVCLKRSHLQLQYLRRLGLDADWVIGVRTWPFMAHCWLQLGAVALDEDVERLIAYTPILVV